KLAHKRSSRLHDARLDLNLRRLSVETGEEGDDALTIGRDVIGDDGAGALIDLDLSFGREERRKLSAHLPSLDVVEVEHFGARRFAQRPRLGAVDLVLELLVELFARCDAVQPRTFELVAQPLRGQDDV